MHLRQKIGYQNITTEQKKLQETMHLITNRRVYIPSKFGVDFPAIAPEN